MANAVLRDLQVQHDLDLDRDGALTLREVQARRDRIAGYLSASTHLFEWGLLDAWLPAIAEHTEGDLLRVA